METNFQADPQKKNTPRDVFLQIFSMVTLYWSAVGLITLCWQIINYYFPDALYNNYGFTFAIRFALSSLLIVFPLFLLVSWVIYKIYQKEITTREGKTRKWLIYLTLFISSLVVVGDLVVTINTFLNGELTARFILKALVVLVVLLSIFGYYLDDVRKSVASSLAKYYAIGVSLVVIALVVWAFFIVGSPMSARLAGFDQQRVYDLQSIQGQILNYWQRKQSLPENLNDLTDSISGYRVPQDPTTKQDYEYRVLDSAKVTFEICATFDTAQSQGDKNASMPVSEFSQNWDHGVGRTCFERNIDTSLYPPLNK